MTSEILTLSGKPLDRSKRNERIAAFLADLSECNDAGVMEAIACVWLRPNGKWQVAWTFAPSEETGKQTDLLLIGALAMAQMSMANAAVEAPIADEGAPA